MRSVRFGRSFAAAVILLTSGAAWAGSPQVLGEDALDVVTAGGIFGFAGGGSLVDVAQLGPGKVSFSQSNVNTVKNSSSGFSASSRVRATAGASGVGVSSASIAGASAVGAFPVP